MSLPIAGIRQPLPGCPLCASSATSLLKTLRAADLKAAYARLHGIDVSSSLGTPALDLLHCSACDLRFFSPASTGDVAFYRALSRLKGYYMEEKSEFQIARRYIGAGQRVLEVGGGSGGFARQLQGVEYVGLEFNDEAAQTARDRGIRMLDEPLEQHATAHAQQYDVVCSFQVLEHVADPRAFLHNALACLKPGGRLILSVPSHDSFLRWAPNLVLNMPPHHVTLWSDRLLLGLGEVLGCRTEDLVHEGVAAYHRPWFLATMLLARSASQRGEAPVLDLGWGMRVRYILAAIVGRILSLAVAPFARRLPVQMQAHGHAVVVVLRK